MPLQNLKEHPRTDYMPLQNLKEHPTVTSSSSDHLIVTRSTAQIHITQRLHQRPWEAHPATMSERLLNTYINAHGRPILPPCRKGSCVSVSSVLITCPWREPRYEENQASL